MTQRPPLPPFDEQSAIQKVQTAEDAWNACDPEKVALGYSENSVWRNRDIFLVGREQIIAFLKQKWERELDYALRKQMWSFSGNRIAVRYQYESHDRDGQWWRSYGNELWEYDEDGLNCRRESSINDVKISASERRIFGPRPESDHGKDVIPLQ
jgi:nuclear transport factor 2 (NTF2) superfamily protein